jgi:hypothetical protein
MILLLSVKYARYIAGILLNVFLGSLIPVHGRTAASRYIPHAYASYKANDKDASRAKGNKLPASALAESVAPVADSTIKKPAIPERPPIKNTTHKKDIGGPSQPEMSSFKSVGADNLVNLFTGDFSYSIPLLEVGGYPVNLFYDGGVSMEQEASWVGLGWNINPGTVSRNMRGVPDDFNGEDVLTQTQDMKPNKTWGVTLNSDMELVGIKALGISVGSTFGISFNNYLGPALDLGIKGGATFNIAGKAGSEKSAVKLGVGIGATVNSRSGLTLSPNVSLTASSFANVKGLSTGLSLGTSYNSRSGIKQLQISEQMSYSYQTAKKVGETKAGDDIIRAGNSSMGASLASTSISFNKPSYTPALRMPLNNEAYAGRFQIGGAIFGMYISAELEVYSQKSSVAFPVQKKPLVGYLYYQKANNNPDAVMDFNRLNDNEVTPNTPIISAPQYSYDVFTIQGEGTGGSIRAYRNDIGYVRDNATLSRDKSLSIGLDVGIPGHFGGNFSTIKTPTVIGDWGYGNKLNDAIGFREAAGTVENVYFRNPGENSVLQQGQWDKIGGTDLVRFKLGGSNASPTIEPVLEKYSKSNSFIGNTVSLTTPDNTERKKRSQVINFLTAAEASIIGLDKSIKSYDATTPVNASGTLQFTSYPRVYNNHKAHHISQINVTEANGKRYVYGIPVYNTLQKDFSFTVTNTGTEDDKVNISSDEASSVNNSKDGFIQVTETPGYAHSFLLTGLLSPDYVDATGNGITEDDLGDAVKFNYTKYANHKWRTPHTAGDQATANFNAGNRTEMRDDKGIISYGERESWYLHSIESKTMIAVFTAENRNDGKGPVSAFNGVNNNDNSLKRLQKIDLYSKADYSRSGTMWAKPIKTVWFEYSYKLCAGTPDNVRADSGKLTLDGIYFTFNGKARANKSRYAFSYANVVADNPAYAFNASDRWGTYKPKAQNPGAMKNSDYPYAVQNKTNSDKNAAAWGLRKILLPSGGQIEVEYEGDDYAWVQNKRAAVMMPIAGLVSDAATLTNKLYSVSAANAGIVENDKVYIKVPVPCTTKEDVYNKYLNGLDQLAFKISVNMPKGVEYINAYATIADYDRDNTDSTRIWIQLNRVDGLSPLSRTTLEYLRERLPGQAFPGYDVSESSGLKQVGEMLLGMLDALKSAFKDPVMYLRSQGKAQTINLANSFVRLNDPDGFKYGGGHRVKSVKLKDNWKAMTKQYDSEYGQLFDYTTTEMFNGAERTISSGVASYEPSIGGEENPFQSIVQIADKLPLGPASYGAVEMPVLDAFFPAPLVGYSKVTVRSLNKNTDTTKRSRSGIGKQVTEYYTAKDFPVYYNHIAFDPSSDKQEHQASLMGFFYKYAFDSRALSQGFIIETNDMHGKMKAKASYTAHDERSPINYTENFYRNTGAKGLNDKFDFVYAAQGGVVQAGNMGIDVELMTDAREFSVKSTSLEVQAQVDLFPVIFPFWLPFIWPVSGECENTYRAVTTTKVISYHSILDSIVVIDKGSQASTRNLVYDAETGDVVVSRTSNAFDKPVYTVKYPAWWAYSGMGLAYKNIDALYTAVDFYGGKMTNGSSFEQSVIESGDELYITNPGAGSSGCVPASGAVSRLWAFDKNKNATALTVPIKDLYYLDEAGKLFTKSGVGFRIVRSGKRNMLDAAAANITLMADPIGTVAGVRKIKIDSSSNVITASAVEYREKWQTDNDAIIRYKQVLTSNNCDSEEVVSCTGYLEKSINPYCKGLMGNFRPYRNLVFYGSRNETNPAVATNVSHNGFLSSFLPYWNFNTRNNLVPNIANAKWVWNAQTTRYNVKGMELETKDALNIYTAAQYGYHKTLPIAITTNSRYHETAFAGFEDYYYTESLNGNRPISCGKGHLDPDDISNIQIVNTDDAGFNAHSGKYVLGLNAGSTMTKQFMVVKSMIDTAHLQLTANLVKLGGWAGFTIRDVYYRYCGSYLYDSTLVFVTNPNTYSIAPVLPFGTANPCLNISQVPTFVVHFFVLPPATGTYTLTNRMLGGKTQIKVRANGTPGVLKYSNFLNYPMGENDQQVSVTHYDNIYQEQVSTHSYYMCQGKPYEFVVIHTPDSRFSHPNQQALDTFLFAVSVNAPCHMMVYKEGDLCDITQPISGSESLLNPIFNIPVSKKMLFSAWVREECTSCSGTGYDSNQVKIEYNGVEIGTTMLKPSGPVIEGWQRYEAEFTAPATATQMTMSLINNSKRKIYFDDIRIHPFNANMKSYVYDPVNLRLVAELDANNYATFYEYDEEGGLIRTKAETREGIKTINETRSYKQKGVTKVQ